MNQLTKLFDEQNLTIINQNDGSHFKLNDICNILGLAPRVVRQRLGDDVCSTNPIQDSLGRTQQATFVNEDGLYDVILDSRKPEAKRFRKWITSEVIPSIRKHGAYMTPETIEQALLNPDTLIKLATNLKEEQTKRIQAEQTIELQKPKVVYADAVSVSKDTVLIKDLATVLKQKGIDIGTNRLFSWLRVNGYLCRQKGEMWNTPTQRSLDLGIMVTKHGLRSGSDGEMKKTRTPKITGKGQIYFVNKFLNKQEAI
ncbi:phage antirepressor [Oceanobacillus profundus]|uniref:phage antirepressor n=1 Tax=Oceanobacillus profundus TaxID=372463 RepID=UPI00203D73AB|nr:phage antirepressor [Oceanobacillus profundus]MCM3396448.1 phage antirepressor [Oceanobacillus profundus]